MNAVLVTGGAGYIGSHTVVELLSAGYDCVVLDNLSNGSIDWMSRASEISGREPHFVRGDIRDRALLDELFASRPFAAVIHLAGLKSVGESLLRPIAYYDNNVHGSLVLIEAMLASQVRTLIFSSSAAVYGEPRYLPLDEMHPTAAINPYGRSKLMIEEMLADLAAADRNWRIATLRYFNPAGAHPSGLIGEEAFLSGHNLLSMLGRVARGSLATLPVFGGDYDTPDGTCMRDLIHVQDLAKGHLCALRALSRRRGAHIWNLGTGRAHSVLEVVRAFEAASGCKIPCSMEPRRPGDVSVGHADPSKAGRELGWSATRDLSDMMRDAWRWQSMRLASATGSAAGGRG